METGQADTPCRRDYPTLGIAEMWNWFEDKLVRGR